jgi:predicted nucleic acid-binding protein
MSYVDTSCLVAYYIPERLSAAIEEALTEQDAPAISRLVELEFHSALSKKVRTQHIEVGDAAQIAAMFRAQRADGYYHVLPVEAREYELARDWLGEFTTPLRTLDALHLATAFANGIELLTTDKPLARCAEHFGVACRLIA